MKSIDQDRLDLSVIFLLEEKSDGFSDYVNRIFNSLKERSYRFEIVIIANGTGNFLINESKYFGKKNSIRAFIFERRTTQAACLMAGINKCNGSKIVVCGSYQQISERSFFEIIDSLTDDIDIVSPWRKNRVDSRNSQVQSRLFNWLCKKYLNTNLNDLSCNVRAFHRNIIKDIKLYGNMYRFLPVLAEYKGYRSLEIVCDHFQERGKSGVYSISDYIGRIIDILTVYFNTKFVRKPLRFFIRIGVLFFISGAIIAFIVVIQKLIFFVGIGDRPILLLSSFLVAFGLQTTSIGLLGEIISFTIGRKTSEYRIHQVIEKNTSK